MNTKTMMAVLALLAAPTAAADGDDGGNCDNYGQIFLIGIGNDYECQVIIQHCDQGTGAGAGAGAGGPGSNEAGAQATAGTNCTQSSDPEEPEDPEEPGRLGHLESIGLPRWRDLDPAYQPPEPPRPHAPILGAS